MGVNVDFKSCDPITLGQFAYVKEKDTDNSMIPVVFPGIALVPSFKSRNDGNNYKRPIYHPWNAPERIKQMTLIGMYWEEDIDDLIRPEEKLEEYEI